MKFLVISFASCVLIILPNYYHVTEGQSLAVPDKFFKKVTFEKINRGGYNVTTCLQDLLNCWEVIKPDVVCFKRWSYDTYKLTVCEMLKDTCDDFKGYIDEKLGTRLTLFETTCAWNAASQFTK
ncbi:uncharacterized protein LOC118268734 [Spodoptera frugiperda]|uniref:Uncharacterized protein LOC118268734 n=1 Tax=Spodoptera frugiperda TaxID=7108 RepID=A0A9R0D407_SPOFR|nr:uncharacterized protein LOC118268734 [Spodoptera frugiperda]